VTGEVWAVGDGYRNNNTVSSVLLFAIYQHQHYCHHASLSAVAGKVLTQAARADMKQAKEPKSNQT